MAHLAAIKASVFHWHLLRMVHLDTPLRATEDSYQGHSGNLQGGQGMKDFYINDENPEIDVALNGSSDKSLVLPDVTILRNDSSQITYRAPMIMRYFLSDVGMGMLMNNSNLLHNLKKNLTPTM
ncbi:hypothetical protein BGZ58_008340 [Dissophora ornata]|nr:hypothetical protein BGZ58_008340 [Dissophora ornata]